jgi:hypothetical protein
MKTTGKRGERVYRYYKHIRSNLSGVLENLLCKAKACPARSGGGPTRCLTAAVCRHDQPIPPREQHKGSIQSIGADFYYFVGNLELYNTIREAFRRQGLEYEGTYDRTAGDRLQRIGPDTYFNRSFPG